MELNKTIQKSKNGSIDNEQNPKGDNSKDRNPRKEIKTHRCITNRIQEMKERISDAEDSIENIDTTVKENATCKKLLTQNIQEIQDTVRRPYLRIMGTEKQRFPT